MVDPDDAGVQLLKVVQQVGNVHWRNLCSHCMQNFPMDEMCQGQEREGK